MGIAITKIYDKDKYNDEYFNYQVLVLDFLYGSGKLYSCTELKYNSHW